MTSTDKDLESLFDEAVRLASRVPAVMQPAAFRVAVELMRTPPNAAEKSRASDPGRPAGPVRRPALNRATSGRPGPQAAIENLLDAGYLDNPRLVGEIRDHLASQGWKYAPKEMATAVLRLLRQRRLSRVKGADGQYLYRSTSV